MRKNELRQTPLSGKAHGLQNNLGERKVEGRDL